MKSERRPMRITIFHPFSSRNAGDWIILKGTERILLEAFGEVELFSQEFGEDFKAEVKDYKSDMLVISGTPWFWDICTESTKYDLLRKVVEVHKDAKKVALGLGACYPLATNVIKNYIEREGDTSGAKERFSSDIKQIFGNFDFITTRDPIAQYILDSLGIKSVELFCPAVFSCEGEHRENEDKKPLLIFINPEEFVSSSSLDAIMKKWLVEFQLSIIKKYKPSIIVSSVRDAEWLQEHKLYGEWILSAEGIIEKIKEHNPIYSSRVHLAIPACVFGKTTYIFTLDTRYLTVSKMGAIPIFPFGWNTDCSLSGTTPDIKLKVAESREIMLKGLKELV